MTERIRYDGSLPSFGTPAIDPKTGQWTEAWRPIVEMLFARTGGDFDAGYFAVSDTDTLRSQMAEAARTLEILGGQVAALRDQVGMLQDEARMTQVEAGLRSLEGRLSGLEATARSDAVFNDAENQDVSFKKLTVNNTANLKGNATVAGSGYQLGFFSYGGALKQAVTFTNTNGAIGGLTISNPPTQAEVQALRDACETLADDTRNFLAAIKAYNLLA